MMLCLHSVERDGTRPQRLLCDCEVSGETLGDVSFSLSLFVTRDSLSYVPLNTLCVHYNKKIKMCKHVKWQKWDILTSTRKKHINRKSDVWCSECLPPEFTRKLAVNHWKLLFTRFHAQHSLSWLCCRVAWTRYATSISCSWIRFFFAWWWNPKSCIIRSYLRTSRSKWRGETRTRKTSVIHDSELSGALR